MACETCKLLFQENLDLRRQLDEALSEINRINGLFQWDNSRISYWTNANNKARKWPEARIKFWNGKEVVCELGCRLYNNITAFDKAFGGYIASTDSEEQRYLLDLKKVFISGLKDKVSLSFGLIKTVSGDNLVNIKKFWALFHLNNSGEHSFFLHTPDHREGLTHTGTPIDPKERSDHEKACNLIAYIRNKNGS